MKLRNILIVIKDIEKSKQFYHELFGLDMVLENEGNKISFELYFEESISLKR